MWSSLGQRRGLAFLQNAFSVCFSASRTICIRVTNALWKWGGSLKTIKLKVPGYCRLSGLSSLPAREYKPCLTSWEASPGRTSFPRILFLAAAAIAVNLQRGLIRQVPFWTPSTLQTSGNHHRHSSMLLFFPPKLAFSSVLAPRPPYTVLAFLNGLFSTGVPPKGLFMHSKTSLFVLSHHWTYQIRPSEGKEENREGSGLAWLVGKGGGHVKGAQEEGTRDLFISS